MGFNEFMTKLFGNKSQRDLKEITPYVDKVKAVYPSIKALSNDELRAKTDEIKQRIQEPMLEIYADDVKCAHGSTAQRHRQQGTGRT